MQLKGYEISIILWAPKQAKNKLKSYRSFAFLIIKLSHGNISYFLMSSLINHYSSQKVK
jgi:hypothetical protein